MKKLCKIMHFFVTIFVLDLKADQFIFSYKLVSKDFLAVKEEFYITPAMTKIESKQKKICEIPIEESDFNLSKNTLLNYKDEFLECLLKNGVKLRSDGVKRDFIDTSQTLLYILPIRLEIIEENGALSIYELDRN